MKEQYKTLKELVDLGSTSELTRRKAPSNFTRHWTNKSQGAWGSV